MIRFEFTEETAASAAVSEAAATSEAAAASAASASAPVSASAAAAAVAAAVAAAAASEAQSSIQKRPTVRSLHRNARLRLLSLLFILFSKTHKLTAEHQTDVLSMFFLENFPPPDAQTQMLTFGITV